jgi:hypothetical protein
MHGGTYLREDIHGFATRASKSVGENVTSIAVFFAVLERTVSFYIK